MSLTNSTIGLALLTGGASGGLVTPIRVESRAVRAAKAQFTLPPVTPPWHDVQPAAPLPTAVAAIKRMSSIVDQVRATATLPPDLQTAFTTFKALDRLRMLAEWAVRSSTSAAERSQLQSSFTKGVADLQTYLAAAPSDRLTLSFAEPRRRADSLGLPPANPLEWRGEALTRDRFAALPGLAGTERFTLSLSRSGGADAVTVDLSQEPQPPTLDGVAAAFNAAIAALPRLDANGAPVLGADGQALSRWDTRFAVVKGEDGWGLELRTMGVEQVSLRQLGAGDSLMVAAGQSVSGAAAGTTLLRFDLPSDTLQRTTIGTLDAVDALATAEARLLPAPKPLLPTDIPPPPVTVPAALAARATVTDSDGFTYVVGTSAGDSGAQVGDGADDLLLSKLDSRGEIIWQRRLGSGGSAEGAALSLAPDGDIIVAGTVTGDLDGANTDGDLLVMRFSASGAEEFSTAVRAIGADRAQAVAVDSSGAILVGGRSAAGEAVVARLDSTGRLLERTSLGTGEIRALAADSDGSLVALTSDAGEASLRRFAAGGLAVTGQLALGAIDARALAISDDGRIAVGGSVTGSGGGRDGRLLLVDRAFSSAITSDLASAGDDRIDSLAWLAGEVYAGGRTSGSLGAVRAGTVDGVVARFDGQSGALQAVSQWGRAGTGIEPVRLSAAPGQDSAVEALGFRTGLLNPPESERLADRTSLRPGDRFAFRIGAGARHELVIGADDTLASLAERMSRLVGRNATIRTAREGDDVILRIEPKPGHSLDLLSGPQGRDALAKLGLATGRLVAAPPFDSKAPRVRPGGTYGLELTTGMSVREEKLAAASLAKLKNAITTTQSAFRSLYWDENKEALVNGAGGSGRLSPYLASQLGRYQDALNRLGTPILSGGF